MKTLPTAKQLTKAKAAVKSGFTIVELTITLAFISVLLITIAIITTNILAIYQKGMAVKAVDSVGRGLIDEFVSAVNTAPSVDTTSLCYGLVTDETARENCIADKAFKYIFQEKRDDKGKQLYGVFCTGQYSYVWNTYETLKDGSDKKPLIIKYAMTESGGGISEFATSPNTRLARFNDVNYRVCSKVIASNYGIDNNDENPFSDYANGGTIDITTLASGTSNSISAPVEGMLEAFDLELLLYDLRIFPISQDNVTLRTYMPGTFVLATNRGNVDLTLSGDYCKISYTAEELNAGVDNSGNTGNLGSEFNYCAINKFNFAARTAGV